MLLNWAEAKLWQELEEIAVAWLKDAEIAPVEGRDARDVKAFRDSHDAAVD